MSKFQVGDAVRVKPGCGRSDAADVFDLPEGSEHTVHAAVGRGFLDLRGDGVMHNPDRFELVDREEA